ncbi:MAG TPA: lantibiotic dehydratase [Kofleriaceae bacterium]
MDQDPGAERTSHFELLPHQVALGSEGWSLWRWVWLRGAGFAARDVQVLGSDALDVGLAAEAELRAAAEQHRTAAIAACTAAIGDGPPSWPLLSARTRIHAGRPPRRPTGEPAIDAAVAAWRLATDELARRCVATDEVVRGERERIGAQIRALAGDPRFREALIWQNRSAHTAVDGLRDAASDATNQKTRERQRALARYAQRYAVKNDSIGFFGPIGWGVVDPTLPGLSARSGPALVDERVVSFEDWAIEAVAAELSKDPAVCAVFTPRRRPTSWLDGAVLHMPPGPPRALSASEAWLVARADGERSAAALVELAVADPASGLPTRLAVLEVLERLGRENVISWRIEVPAELDHPARWLRERVGQLADPDARARACAPIDRLEAARTHVARAAGDPDALAARVTELEEAFHAATGLSAKRGHGRTYAGRQTFFEDCRRAIDLRVGRAVLDALADPLTLVLHSARWYCHEIARRFRAGFDEAYDRALPQAATRPLPLISFLTATRGLFSRDHHQTGPIVTVVQRELQRRWVEILGLDGASPGDARQVRAADCRAKVAELFDAPGPGWPRARYHSPDVMLAAASVEHVAAGEFLAVLGEVHPGINTLLSHVAYRLHPERAALDAAYEADLAMTCISPIQNALGRATNSPMSPRDHHVEVGATRSWRARDQVHLAGDLYVERIDGSLRVRSRLRELDHDILSFMEAYLGAEAAPHFKLLPRAPHLPRVVIDQLVVSRERWHFERAELRALVDAEHGAERDPIRRVRTWADQLGLPRYLFGTVPHEPKPFYLDLGSPIYIDIFVRYLADATSLGLSEMLPGHADLWLTDAAGAAYTSELRFAAVDPQPWAPPPRRA